MNNIKAFLFQSLVSRKLIGQTLKYIAGALAAYLVVLIAASPGWVQGLLAYLSESIGFELNEASLTVLLTMAIAGAVQFFLDRSNAKGIDKLQDVLEVERDSWAGTETQDAASNLKAKYEAVKREIEEIKAAVAEGQRSLKP